jgi:MFS family permease
MPVGDLPALWVVHACAVTFVPLFPARWRYVTAMTVDAMGSGLYLPFSLLYFHFVSGLPLPTVGAGLSIAALLGLAGNPVSGVLVDRFGARQVIVAGYLLRAAGFAYYLAIDNFPELVVATSLVAFGDRSFPPAIQSLMTDLSTGIGRDRMVALQRSVRNAGMGLGGLAASGALWFATDSAYKFIVLADAVSFLVAAGCIFTVRATRPIPHSTDTAAVQQPTYRAVLRDRPFLWMTLANVPIALCYNALLSLLPIFIVEVLHEDPQLPGLIFALQTALVAVGQIPVSRLQEGTRRTRAAALGAFLFGTSCLGFAALVWVPSGPLVVVGLIVISVYYTIAEMLHSTPSWSLASETAPPFMRGRYLAVYQMSFSLAGVVAPTLFTSLLAIDAKLVWVLVGVGAVAGGTALIRLEPRLPSAAVLATLAAPRHRARPNRTDTKHKATTPELG